MARYTGAVRFGDGELRYFVFDGTTDTARRRLYISDSEAFSAWDTIIENDKSCVACDDQEVEVMPYFCHGDQRIAFTSMASKDRTRLTGITSVNTLFVSDN
ncbi:hypothetical protein A1356_16030 [Methylomonas koyamae]|uniref:Uncharacterized protein n=1 Tax=Methylomonas koyamae TaxID=702114 RepID=A0AA91I4E4_9GAMM|nr:hypothetical protein AYM39_22660 [Methylomonas sp. DH-1]OAI24192.1 hypothetical protein A1356_16030 [Methylomonas koyamae]